MPADFPIEILIGIRQESFENSIKILVPSAFLTQDFCTYCHYFIYGYLKFGHSLNSRISTYLSANSNKTTKYMSYAKAKERTFHCHFFCQTNEVKSLLISYDQTSFSSPG